MTSYRLVKTAFATTAALGIQCLACGRISYNVHDIRERYCGLCHRFHEDADVPRGTLSQTPVSDTPESQT